MTVFALWNAGPDAPKDQARLVAAWIRACEDAGRVPRLLTAKSRKAHKRRKLADLEAFR